jgi:hypothetical protein
MGLNSAHTGLMANTDAYATFAILITTLISKQNPAPLLANSRDRLYSRNVISFVGKLPRDGRIFIYLTGNEREVSGIKFCCRLKQFMGFAGICR